MDLLCEPDASDLLANLLCTLWTSCSPAASIMFSLDHIASLGPPVAVPPSNLLWPCLPQTSCGCDSLGATVGPDTGGPSHRRSGPTMTRTSCVRTYCGTYLLYPDLLWLGPPVAWISCVRTYYGSDLLCPDLPWLVPPVARTSCVWTSCVRTSCVRTSHASDILWLEPAVSRFKT